MLRDILSIMRPACAAQPEAFRLGSQSHSLLEETMRCICCSWQVSIAALLPHSQARTATAHPTHPAQQPSASCHDALSPCLSTSPVCLALVLSHPSSLLSLSSSYSQHSGAPSTRASILPLRIILGDLLPKQSLGDHPSHGDGFKQRRERWLGS